MLSVVLPVYNEEQNIVRAYEAIRDVLMPNGIAFELVFVNDGSKDNSFEVIRKLSESVCDAKIIGLSFSRNFGKEAAIFTGLSHATGDVCAVMDCDLQHPPETLVEMYDMWKQGFEIIEGVKVPVVKKTYYIRGLPNYFIN